MTDFKRVDKMKTKTRVRVMLDLIEIYQRVNRHYEIDKSLIQCSDDLTKLLIDHQDTFKDNEELQELFKIEV